MELAHLADTPSVIDVQAPYQAMINACVMLKHRVSSNGSSRIPNQ